MVLGTTPEIRRLIVAVAAVAGLLSFTPAARAQAEPLSCHFSEEEGTLHITGTADGLTLAVYGDSGIQDEPGPLEIGLNRYGEHSSSPIDCGPGTPTPDNVDTVVAEVEGATEFVIEDPAAFAPGRTPEAEGDSEIEMQIDLGQRLDSLAVTPEQVGWICCHVFFRRPLDVRVRGAGMEVGPVAGVPDLDIEWSGVEALRAGVPGGDYGEDLTVRGSARGPALPITAFGGFGDNDLRGGSDDDRLQGHSRWGCGVSKIGGRRGRDQLQGGCGNDTLRGGRGADRLWGDFGADVLLGGDGPDTIDARDGEADTLIDCGQGGSETVLLDEVDPPPVDC